MTMDDEFVAISDVFVHQAAVLEEHLDIGVLHVLPMEKIDGDPCVLELLWCVREAN